MGSALLKRSAESLRFDIDCSVLLAEGETIIGTPALSVDEPTLPPLVADNPVVSTADIDYGDHVAPAGTVVQVQISGGCVMNVSGVQTYTLRCRFNTTIAENLVEATVPVSISDSPN